MSAIICRFSAGRLAVDTLSQSDGGQLLIGRLFLVKIGRKQSQDVVVPELVGPGDQRTVARDLIMLDRLGGADDGGVQNFLVGHFTRDLVRLLDEAIDGGALYALRRLAQLLEHLIEP